MDYKTYTFIYDGSGLSYDDMGGRWAEDSVTRIFCLEVFYGNLATTEGPYPLTGHIAPIAPFPRLPRDVKVTATMVPVSLGEGGGPMKLIDRTGIYDDGSYIGERFIFSAVGQPTDGTQYQMKYDVEEITVPYARDLLKIKGQSGNGPTFYFND